MPDEHGHLQRVTTEIEEVKIMYDIPFTAENVDNLLKLQNSRGCVLYVKDELSTRAVTCPSIGNVQNKTIRLYFKRDWQSRRKKN